MNLIRNVGPFFTLKTVGANVGCVPKVHRLEMGYKHG